MPAMDDTDSLRWWTCPYTAGWTVASLIDDAGRRHAARPCLYSDAHGVVTHGDIRDQAARLRGAIRSVATCASRTAACLATLDAPWYVAIQAILTSGLAYAAMDPDAPDARNLMCLEDCGADIIVSDSASLEKAHRLAAGKRTVVSIERASDGPFAEAVPVRPIDTAAYIFTSGSTGRPKAVVRSHASLAHAIYCLAENYEYAANDVMLYPGSPGHVGSLNDALSCMLTGFESIPIGIASIDLGGICRLLEQRNATVMAMPPSLLRLLLRVMADSARKFALRSVIASGEALLRSDVRLFHELLEPAPALWQNYGSTETGPMYAGRYTRDDAAGIGPLPLRRAHQHCRVDVVDQDMRPVPAGDSGELVVRSPFLADGYLNAPPDQAARFGSDSDGHYFRIGDHGYRSAAGELYVAGRGDRQVKVHGRRLELGDIESAIMSNRAWAEAVVVKSGPPGTSPTLVAVICPDARARPDVAALRSDLEAVLPHALIPRRFVVVEQMPRTTTGKIDLVEVERIATTAAGAAPSGVGGPPIGPMEWWLANCWEYVLNIPRPGREDRFQDLGGDSLAAIELSLVLEKRFGVKLSMDRFAELQTIASQVGALQEGQLKRGSGLVWLRQDGQGPLCVLFPGIGGHAWVFTELCRQLEGPCDVACVSLTDLDRTHGGLTRDLITKTVAEAIAAGGARTRRVFLGGFSFGALIACDVGAALVTDHLPPERLLLIDPSPLDPDGLPGRAMKWLRSLRSQAWSHAGSTARSAPARELELQVARMSTLLGKLYAARTRLPDSVPYSVLISAEMRRQVKVGSTVCGMPLPTDRSTDVPCSHVDLLRLPSVAQTARWFDTHFALRQPGAAGDKNAARGPDGHA